MSGDLLEFDGITYRLKLTIGEISIDASRVVCEGSECPNIVAGLSEFTIAGSNSIGAELLPTLIEVYALDRGGDLDVSISNDGTAVYSVLEADGSVYATISVVATDSTDGFTGLMENSAAIGMSSRPISDNEAAAFDLSGKGNLSTPEQERIVAMDGVIVALNHDNPVSILSLDQVAAIFAGSITNWNQVGGADAPISLYRRDEAAGTSVVFSQVAMVPTGAGFSGQATVLDTDADVSDAVAADINGIGITSYAQERNTLPVKIRSVCGQIFEPTEFSIQTEEYPLSRRMYLYTNGDEIPDIAKEFLDFATSDAAQSVIANTGFIGQLANHTNLDHQGRRMAQAIVGSSGRTELLQLQDLTAILLDAERLSFTLRTDETGTFDSRALADIGRLGKMIGNGDFSSRQILVLGFSDDSAGVNAQLSATQDLAQGAQNAIVAAVGRTNLGNVRISPIGYGRLFPLGCNETPIGRTANNRVEIWVR